MSILLLKCTFHRAIAGQKSDARKLSDRLKDGRWRVIRLQETVFLASIVAAALVAVIQ
jgi:hypothetical protein